MEYFPLKLVEPRINNAFRTNEALDEVIQEYAVGYYRGGKNADIIKSELLLAHRTACRRNGSFRVSTQLYDDLYNTGIRKRIMPAIEEISERTESHVPGVRCIQRQLHPQFYIPHRNVRHNRWSKSIICNSLYLQYPDPVSIESSYSTAASCQILTAHQSFNSSGSSAHYPCSTGFADSVDSFANVSAEDFLLDMHSDNNHVIGRDVDNVIFLDSAFLQLRQEKWATIVNDNTGWCLNYCQGTSAAGRATLDSLSAVSIPRFFDFSCLDGEKLEHAVMWYEKLQAGVPRAVLRSHGRLYHVLVFINKLLRHACLLNNEPSIEIDMSCTFHALLVSNMNASCEKDYLISQLESGTFYQPFFDAYPHLDRADVKRDIQKQLLFPRDLRLKSRPLLQICQQAYPEYSKFVECVRKKHKCVSKFAKNLMKRESSIWIDQILVAVFDNGRRPVIPLHDAIMVRESDAREAHDIAYAIIKKELGFVPLLKAKRAGVPIRL